MFNPAYGKLAIANALSQREGKHEGQQQRERRALCERQKAERLRQWTRVHGGYLDGEF